MIHPFYYLVFSISIIILILFYLRKIKSKSSPDPKKTIFIEKIFTHPVFQERNQVRKQYLESVKFQENILSRFKHLHESHLERSITEDRELEILTQLQQQYLINKQQTLLARQQYLEKQQHCFEHLLTEVLPQVVADDSFQFSAHFLTLDGKLGLAADLEHNKLFIWEADGLETAYIVDGTQLLQLEAHVDSDCLYSLKADDLSSSANPLALASIMHTISNSRLIDRLLSLELKLFINRTEDTAQSCLTILFFQRGSGKSPYAALEEIDNWYCLLSKLMHQSQLAPLSIPANRKPLTSNAMINEISRLAELRTQGMLTDDEFNKAKRILFK